MTFVVGCCIIVFREFLKFVGENMASFIFKLKLLSKFFDILSKYTPEYAENLKRKLNIPDNKKIILYAPTFREYSKDSMQNCILLPPMTLTKWKKILGNEYILLFRAHYEVSKHMKITDDDFIKDMTNYPHLENLMIISDLLISDYSSIFFDYG